MRTNIGTNSPLTVKKWRSNLMMDTFFKSYFTNKFVGDSDKYVIQTLKELENEAGDTIYFDLIAQLRQKPTYGDDKLQGKAEALRYYQDKVKIDQIRHAVDAGGKMTRKRTIHDVRMNAKDRMSDYWAKFNDELMFMYLSGARGINEDFYETLGYVGHAGNGFETPDADHILYGGDPTTVTSKATLVAGSKMTRDVIERASTKAQMMRARDKKTANLQPVMINGEAHYVIVMTPDSAYDLRVADTNGWYDIQKAAANAEGRKNPIFKGGLGMIDDVVLHKHHSVIRFDDYGAANNVHASRALFMGRQAGVVAYGQSGGMRYDWNEETTDHSNVIEIASGLIYGCKKTRFNGRDFGVFSIDVASKDPNAA